MGGTILTNTAILLCCRHCFPNVYAGIYLPGFKRDLKERLTLDLKSYYNILQLHASKRQICDDTRSRIALKRWQPKWSTPCSRLKSHGFDKTGAQLDIRCGKIEGSTISCSSLSSSLECEISRPREHYLLNLWCTLGSVDTNSHHTWTLTKMPGRRYEVD